VEPRLSFVTLGVSNLERATHFYEHVLKLPRIATPPSLSFFELGKTWLALYPREELAKDVGVSPHHDGFPGFALAHNVRSEAEVDQLLGEIESAGGQIVKSAHKAEWGGYTGYFADPDGFLWEVAWNPHFPHI
jgi:hypothetical protein